MSGLKKVIQTGNKKKVEDGIESHTWQILTSVLTMVLLFMDDIRVSSVPHVPTTPSADDIFGVITLVLFCVFLFDFCASVWAMPGYCEKKDFPKMTFFFWLDLFALITILIDVPWVYEPLFASGTTGTDQLSTLKATKASKVGAKMGRILKLVRLVRVVKLFELCGKTTEKHDKKNDKEFAESNIGQHLSEQTTRKVVIMVLLMLFVMPVLSEIFGSSQDTFITILREVVLEANNPNVSIHSWNSTLSWMTNHMALQGSHILQLAVSANWTFTMGSCFVPDGFTCLCENTDCVWTADNYTNWRASERTTATWDDDGGESIGQFSIIDDARTGGLYNIILTIVVIVLLSAGAWFFNQFTHTLVVHPIERMLDTINQLKDKPLEKMDDKMDDEANETGMLERTLRQLTGLLQVGFGEAGANMIAKSMNTESGDLNPLVDGTKMMAIFGFCDIRRFTDATECLKEEVMMYVNEIAEIVHGITKEMSGSPNKNVGDAFLLVWRLSEKMTEGDVDMISRGKPEGIDPELVRELNVIADKSLVAFVKIYLEIRASEKLKKYKVHPGIIKTFGDDFRVGLGFGLHVGWAIEGPIGSRYKIDASYLSPHVYMSEAVQDFCKVYNVPILMSGEFVATMSPEFRTYLRHIDRCMTAGRLVPMDVYTLDVLDVNMHKLIDDTQNTKYDPYCSAFVPQDLKTTYKLVRNTTLDTLAVFPAKFKPNFSKGIGFYIAGDWEKASLHWQICLDLHNDPPTVEMFGFIKKHDFKAPKDWPGYRDL